MYCEFRESQFGLPNPIRGSSMETRNEGAQVHQEWAEGVDYPLPPEIEGCKAGGVPGSLAGLPVRLGIQRWPDGEEVHFHAKLSESLREVMGHGAKALGEELLPPGAPVPLDL